jgi:hypothetical protein
MKNLQVLIFFAFLLFSSTSNAQMDKLMQFSAMFGDLTALFESKVNIDVDTTIFNKRIGNFYLAGENNAAIIPVLAPPGQFKTAEDFFKIDSGKMGFTVNDKGKYKENDREIWYQKGMVEQFDKQLLFHLYAIRTDEKNTILIAGIFLPENEKELAVIIKKAAASAVLK